jgi:hypothetical protein
VFKLDGLEYLGSAGIRCFVRARLPSEQVFDSEAEFDAYLDIMQRRARKES